MFKYEQLEYALEKIKWTEIEYEDNSGRWNDGDDDDNGDDDNNGDDLSMTMTITMTCHRQ